MQEIHSRAVHGPLHSIQAPDGFYQCDITFMPYSNSKSMLKANKSFKCLFLCVEVSTRYAYLIPMRDKSADEVLEAFAKVLYELRDNMQHFPKALTSDRGTEFTNKKFTDLLQHWNIKQFLVEPQTHYSLGIIDRLCRTVKTWITQDMEERQSINWIDHIQDVIDKYNWHVNSRLKACPNILRSDPSSEAIACDIAHDHGLKGDTYYHQFKVGDKVRILLGPSEQTHDKSSITKFPWKKGNSRWSYKVYTIVGSHDTDPNIGSWSWKLVDSDNVPAERTYRSHELKLVKPDSKDVTNIWEKVAAQDRRNRRMDKEDILPKESTSYSSKPVIVRPHVTEEPISLRKSKRAGKKRDILDL